MTTQQAIERIDSYIQQLTGIENVTNKRIQEYSNDTQYIQELKLILRLTTAEKLDLHHIRSLLVDG